MISWHLPVDVSCRPARDLPGDVGGNKKKVMQLSEEQE
jgi:hypothetical protein